MSKIDGTGEQKLTGFNDAVNKEVAWSDAERFTYKSVDNTEIEAWLMKPYGYQPGKKYRARPLHSRRTVRIRHTARDGLDEFQNLAGARLHGASSPTRAARAEPTVNSPTPAAATGAARIISTS